MIERSEGGMLTILNFAPLNSRIRRCTRQNGLQGNWINRTIYTVNALCGRGAAEFEPSTQINGTGLFRARKQIARVCNAHRSANGAKQSRPPVDVARGPVPIPWWPDRGFRDG